MPTNRMTLGGVGGDLEVINFRFLCSHTFMVNYSLTRPWDFKQETTRKLAIGHRSQLLPPLGEGKGRKSGPNFRSHRRYSAGDAKLVFSSTQLSTYERLAGSLFECIFLMGNSNTETKQQETVLCFNIKRCDLEIDKLLPFFCLIKAVNVYS